MTGQGLARWIELVGKQPPPGERWLNWVVCRRSDGEVVGTVQATVVGDEASIAWVVGTLFQGSGYAKEAAAGMTALADVGGRRTPVARRGPSATRGLPGSRAIHRALAPTQEIDDGEFVWRRWVAGPVGCPFAAAPGAATMSVPNAERSALATTKTTRRTLTAVVLAAGKGKRLKSATPEGAAPDLRAARRSGTSCRRPRGASPRRSSSSSATAPTRSSEAVAVVEPHAEAGVRRAARAARDRPRGRRWPSGPSAAPHDVLVARRRLRPGHPRTTCARSSDASAHATSRPRSSTTELDDPRGYGRVIRDGDRLVDIVEHADATPAQRAIDEVWLLAYRVPPGGSLPRAPARRPREPPARVLPERRVPDPDATRASGSPRCASTPAA